MTYNPEIHHRRSIRLKGFDYSRQGLYFITICTQEKECLFGDIGIHLPGVISLNKAGEMTTKWYDKLPEKYPDKICHEMIVMPNHIHFIIENMGNNGETGNVDGAETHDIVGARFPSVRARFPIINQLTILIPLMGTRFRMIIQLTILIPLINMVFTTKN
jgi:REP element-mobilizing transposase RayT